MDFGDVGDADVPKSSHPVHRVPYSHAAYPSEPGELMGRFGASMARALMAALVTIVVACASAGTGVAAPMQTTVADQVGARAVGHVSSAPRGQEPPSLEDLYAQVESGVAQIAASTCAGTGVGSAFLVSPDRAVTAAHVVAGAVSVAVDVGGDMMSGTVIGIDASLDVALIQLERPAAGHVFTLSASTLRRALPSLRSASPSISRSRSRRGRSQESDAPSKTRTEPS